MSMLIIADDLSGAADCAIGFVCAGLRTVVALNPAQVTGDAQVIAVDTDSRRLPAGEAAECASAAYQAL
ncbi:four-carbon acid sugar kinase family protein, partial [Pseudomonas gingeri]